MAGFEVSLMAGFQVSPEEIFPDKRERLNLKSLSRNNLRNQPGVGELNLRKSTGNIAVRYTFVARTTAA
jgi:hypothetical protein